MIKSTYKYNRGSDRFFGLLFAFIFLIISYYFRNFYFAYIFLTLGVFMFILSIFLKESLKIPNILWISFGEKLAIIVSPIIIFILFCFLFVPIGFLLRIAGVDNLKLKNSTDKSFWNVRKLRVQPFIKPF